MKKIMAFLLAATMLATFVACGSETVDTTPSVEPVETTTAKVETTAGGETALPETTTESTTESTEETTLKPDEPTLSNTFDPTKIVFSFAAISDVHIEGTTTTPAKKFTSALQQLKATAAIDDADGIDAVFVVGDLIDHGYQGKYEQTDYFKQLYEGVFNPVEVPMIYTIGNHDPKGWWSGATAYEAKNISKRLGENYFLTDIDKEMLEEEECRHCVINGYHVLTLTPCTQDPVTYMPSVLTWLDEQLAAITEENPNQFVFVLTHAMIYNTVYGSDLGTYWYTKELTPILEKYPQVVTFGGHLHFPLNDPRSIMQTAFTSLGCGSVRYMAIEDGKYENMAGATTMADKDEFSQGLLVQIDENGNMRIKRMDFYHNEVIKGDWEVSHPTADGSHLQKYSWARGDAENNTAPVMNKAEIVAGPVVGNSRQISVKFDAAVDDEFAHHYVIELKGATRPAVKKVLADFYRHSDLAEMQDSYTVSFGMLSAGKYSATVTAYDSWGAVSNTVTAELEVTIEATEQQASSVYADLDFSNGTVVDSKGNLIIENHGATVEKKTMMAPNAKKADVEVLSAGADKYLICKFAKLKTQADVEAFAAGGFSVEAFYVTKGKTGKVQGIVCGTQDGGWGLAETVGGNPYFITGVVASGSTKYNPSVTASSASSDSMLVHVVATYDPVNGESKLYINGVLDATQKVNGAFKVAVGSGYNLFAIGYDITASGTGGDFPVNDLSVVDVKIYTGVVTADQVKADYAVALSSFK